MLIRTTVLDPIDRFIATKIAKSGIVPQIGVVLLQDSDHDNEVDTVYTVCQAD